MCRLHLDRSVHRCLIRSEADHYLEANSTETEIEEFVEDLVCKYLADIGLEAACDEVINQVQAPSYQSMETNLSRHSSMDTSIPPKCAKTNWAFAPP